MNIQEASEVNGRPTHHFSPFSAGCGDADLYIAMRTDVNVLLTGPADAALAVAQRIHNESGWRYGPFVVVDCADPIELDGRLVEAFSGGKESLDEPLRLIQAGTVLLHEVGRMPLHIQPVLDAALVDLRRRHRSRCRVLASSSECLTQRIQDGTFDERLFYRLNVIHIKL